jgi:hypothetical protein
MVVLMVLSFLKAPLWRCWGKSVPGAESEQSMHGCDPCQSTCKSCQAKKIAAFGSSYMGTRIPVGAAEGCDLLLLKGNPQP